MCMRKLKVQPFIIPARYPNYKARIKPVIKLQGNWLQELGFLAGDYVEIVPAYGKIIIQPANGQDQVTGNSLNIEKYDEEY